MFLERIRLVYISPCTAGLNRVRALGRVDADMSPVFPYLARALEGSVCDRARRSLTFRQGPRVITLLPTEVTIANAESSTDVLKTVEWLKEVINGAWYGRH